MFYKKCPDAVVLMLIQVVCLERNKGSIADLEALMNALHDLRPNLILIQLDVFDAWLYMRRNRWTEALYRSTALPIAAS